MRTIFFDADTQKDLMGKAPDGPAKNLKELTELARRHGVQIVSSMLRCRKDAKTRGRPVCVDGTAGQRKIPETEPHGPVYAEIGRRYMPTEIERMRSSPETIIEKETLDPFSNPAAKVILRGVKEAYVYGSAPGAKEAVIGLLRMKAKAFLVMDAIHATPKERTSLMLLKRKGATIMAVKDVLRRLA